MMLMDYSSPRAARLGVRWLEAMLLETPAHPTGPTIYRSRTSMCYAVLVPPVHRAALMADLSGIFQPSRSALQQ